MKTQAEIDTLAEIERVQAAGGDPFGDDELGGATVLDKVSSATAAENAAEAAATENQAAEGATAGTEQIETSEAAIDDAEPQPQFVAQVPEDYKAQREALMKEKAEAMKKLMDGELDPDAFAETESRVSNALEELTAQRIRAETLIEANAQNQAAYQKKQIAELIDRAKDEVDYKADPKAPKQFDQALSLVSSDPDNAGKDFRELVADAHKMVLALRGITPTTKGADVAAEVLRKAAEARKPDGTPPVTLRNLPIAQSANSGGDAIEALSRLKGAEYEAGFAKLSPAQRAKLLDEA